MIAIYILAGVIAGTAAAVFTLVVGLTWHFAIIGYVLGGMAGVLVATAYVALRTGFRNRQQRRAALRDGVDTDQPLPDKAASDNTASR